MQRLIDKGNCHYYATQPKHSIGLPSVSSLSNDLDVKLRSALVEGNIQIKMLIEDQKKKEKLAVGQETFKELRNQRGAPNSETKMIDCFYEEAISNNPQIMKELVNPQNQKKNGVKQSGSEFDSERSNDMKQNSQEIGASSKHEILGTVRTTGEGTRRKNLFFVRLPSGQTIRMKSEPEVSTISDLQAEIWSKIRKEKLQSLDAATATSINISYHGRTFGEPEKYKKVSEVGIQPYMTLQANFVLLGGSEVNNSEPDISRQVEALTQDRSEETTSNMLMQLLNEFGDQLKNKQGREVLSSHGNEKISKLEASPVLKDFQKYIVGLDLDNAQVMNLAIKLGLTGSQRDTIEAFCSHKLRHLEILLILPTMSEYQKRSLLKDLLVQLTDKLAQIEATESAPDKSMGGEENEESKGMKTSDARLGPTQTIKGIFYKEDTYNYADAKEKIETIIEDETKNIDLQDENFDGSKIADLWFRFASQTRKAKLCENSLKACEELTNAQWCTIFLEILTDGQLNAIFEALAEDKITSESEQDTSKQANKFWECLSEDQRIRIFENLTEQMQKEILSIPSKFIDQNQTISLWSDIICLRQARIFEDLDKVTCENILKVMETSMQIAIWQQISTKEQIDMFKVLDKKEFWNNASFKMQQKILEGLENDQEIRQLLNLLDQDTISISVCMHRERLWHILTKTQQLSVEEYIKYGVSSTTDKDKKVFVQELMDKQYEDFNSLKMLKNKGQYKQVMKNPKEEQGLIVVQDFKPNFEYDNDKECPCLKILKKKKAKASGKITKSQDKEESSACLHQRDNVVRLIRLQENGTYDVCKSDPIHENCQIISFWNFVEAVGLYCTRSFLAPHMLSSLIQSQDGDVYFIQRRGDRTKGENPSQKSLFLHILKLEKPKESPQDRELKNNCDSHKIPPESHFANSFLGEITYGFIKQELTLIKIKYEEEKDETKLMVYTSDVNEEKGIFFYDFKSRKTIAKISDAKLLIDCYSQETKVKKEIEIEDKKDIEDTQVKEEIEDTQVKEETEELKEQAWYLRYIREDNMLCIRRLNKESFSSQKEGKVQELKFDESKEEEKDYEISFEDFQNYNNQSSSQNHVVTTKSFKYDSKVEIDEKALYSFEVLIHHPENPDYSSENQSVTFSAFAKDKTSDQKEFVFKGTHQIYDSLGLLPLEGQEKGQTQQFVQQNWWEKTYIYKVNDKQLDLENHEIVNYDCKLDKTTYNFQYPEPCYRVSRIFEQKNRFMGLAITKLKRELVYFSVLKSDISESNRTFSNIVLNQLEPKIEVCYPIVAYTGVYPDNRNIIIGNLADSQYPQEIIRLPEGRQLVSFAGSNSYDDIKLMTISGSSHEDFSLCKIKKPFPFKKRKIYGESSDISFECLNSLHMPEKNDSDQDDKKNQKVEKVAALNFDSRLIRVAECFDSTIVCQTSEGIWKISARFNEQISTSDFKNTIDMKRCKDRSIYWIEYSKQSQVTTLRRLSKQAILERKSEIAAFKLVDVSISDLLVVDKIKNEKLSDQIFLFDKDDLKLYSFKTKIDDVDKSKNRIEQLSEAKNIAGLLNIDNDWLETQGMQRMYLERDKNHSYMLDTPSSIYSVQEKGIVYHNFDTEASSVVCTSHTGFKTKMNAQDEEFTIVSQNKISFTNRRMAIVKKQETKDFYIMSYHSLQSREHDLLGFIGCETVKTATFISQNKILVNLQHSQDSYNDQHYWTVVESSGQIKQLPQQLTDDWSLVLSQTIEEGTLLIFKSNWSYKYLKFNLRGEIINEKCIEELCIEEIIKGEYDRQGKVNLAVKNKNKVNPLLQFIELDGHSIINSLKMSENFLCNRYGRVFQLATVIGGSNDHNSKLSIEDQENENFSLYGAFVIKQCLNDTESQIERDEQFLTVLIMKCQTKEQSHKLLKESATICGDYLCYQTNYHRRTKIDSYSNSIDESEDQVGDLMQDDDDLVLIKSRQQSSHQSQEQKSAQKDSLNKTTKSFIRMISLTEIMNKVESSIKERASKIIKQDIEEQHGESNSELRMNTDMFVMSRNYDSVFGKSQSEVNLGYQSWLWVRDSKIKDQMKISTKSLIENSADPYINLECVYNSMYRLALRTPCDKETKAFFDDKNDSLMQLTMSDKVLLYDLSDKKPKEVWHILDTNFFQETKNFVELGLKDFLTKKYTSKDGMHVWRQVSTNHSKANYMVKNINYQQTYDDEENQDVLTFAKKSEDFQGLFKTYSMMDLQGLDSLLNNLSKETDEDEMVERAQFLTTLVSFNGHNVFSIFKESENDIQKIIELIKQEIDSIMIHDETTETQGAEYVYMRLLYRILTMPTPQFKGQKFQKIDWGLKKKKDEDSKNQELRKKYKLQQGNDQKLSKKDQLILNNVQKQSPFTTAARDCIFFKQSVRDLFLQLASKNCEFKLSDFAIEQTMTGHMIMKYSSTLHQFFIDQVSGTPMTSKVQEILWPVAAQKISKLTFRREQQFITEERLQKEILKHFKDTGVSTRKVHQAQVDVKVLNADWLLHGGVSLIDFSYKLFGSSSERIFETEFMQVLVQGFWNNQAIWIKGFCFVPWIIYMMSTLLLFSLVMNSQYDDQRTDLYYALKYLSSSVTIILLVFQFYVKFQQMKARGSISSKSLKDFFKNKINILDLFQYISTAWILLSNINEQESSNKRAERVLASFSVFVLWLKVFDWLRLFDSTSFYIKLLIQTFIDIEAFILLFFAGLGMVGCSMFMLSLNTEEEKETVITPIFDVFIVDSILNQYMLALGEFQMDAFDDNPQWYLCYIFFLVATFVTQVTMFNMLIAIMGNTFSMVIEKREIYATMEKLSIMSEYSSVFWFRNSDDKENYLFVVKQVVNEDEEGQGENDWEGGFSQIKKTLTKKMDNLDRKFVASLKASTYRQKVQVGTLNSSLSVEMKQIRSQINVQKDETKSMVKQITTNFNKLDAENAELKSQVKLLCEKVSLMHDDLKVKKSEFKF